MVSIIIPCYNEKGNITALITRLVNVLKNNEIDGEFIIIDDNSPDGTGKIALEMKERCHNLKVVIRENERGLSTAVIKGFEAAKGEILLVMDADLSHPPEIIPSLIEPIKNGNCEMVIGSRYTKGGEIKNLSLKRRVISKITSLIAKTVVNLKDPFSGFFALKRNVIKGIKLSPKGFKIGFEIIIKGNYKNIIEIPYVFQNRKYGKSKLTNQVMQENISHFFSLIFIKNNLLRQFLDFTGNTKYGTN